MSNFKIICKDRNNYEIPYSKIVFAGGEIQIRLLKFPVDYKEGDVVVDGLIKNSEMLMEFLMLGNALKVSGKIDNLTGYIHYLPYARQDRVCSKGEAFSVQQAMVTLDRGSYDTIIVDDVHSSVPRDFYDEHLFEMMADWEFIPQHELMLDHIPSVITLVSPDKGAKEKTGALGFYTKNNVAQYNKVRNQDTGAIEKTELVQGIDLVDGKDCLIVDDILDGGRTFVPIIQDLLDKGAKSVSLVVTHAIVSYGLDTLKEAGLSSLFYVNSFLDNNLKDMYHISRMKETLKGETNED